MLVVGAKATAPKEEQPARRIAAVAVDNFIVSLLLVRYTTTGDLNRSVCKEGGLRENFSLQQRPDNLFTIEGLRGYRQL
jgi:hypothetical protein